MMRAGFQAPATSAADPLDKVDPNRLAEGADAVAKLTWMLREGPMR